MIESVLFMRLPDLQEDCDVIIAGFYSDVGLRVGKEVLIDLTLDQNERGDIVPAIHKRFMTRVKHIRHTERKDVTRIAIELETKDKDLIARLTKFVSENTVSERES